MLQKSIQGPEVPDHRLPKRSGREVAAELAGRLLYRYVPYTGVHEKGHSGPTFVCPTPYAGGDIIEWLALPRPDLVRDYVLLLDPALIAEIQGPRWCSLGGGIEYILPNGYLEDAIIPPSWAVRVR
jgi:hypothetical protein